MPDNTGQGDLIVSIPVVLDDAQYRQDMAAAVTFTQEQIRKITETARNVGVRLPVGFVNSLRGIDNAAKSASAQVKIINAAAQEAHQRFGVMANAVTGASTAMRLLTGESGYAAIETGRLILYFGRAITSGGGVAASFVTMAKAVQGFVLSIGPIGWILGAAGVAYYAFSKSSKLASDENEKFAKTQKEINEELEKFNELVAKTQNELDLLSGKKTPAQVRIEELAKQFPLQAGNIDKDEAERRRVLSTLPGVGGTDPFAFKDPLQAQVEREAEAAQGKIDDAIRERTQSLRLQISILRDEGTIYDLIGNAAERALTIERDRTKALKDLRDQRSELLQKQIDEAGGTQFGITTQPVSGFQFGFGAAGSVVGQQNEAKKTNDLLGKALAKLDALILEARRAVGEVGYEVYETGLR